MHQLVTLLQQSELTLITVLFILGACVGSFLNVLILRLPPLLFYQWNQQCLEMLGQNIDSNDSQESEALPPNLIYPRSRCPDCLSPLKALHNIPILGFVFLGGKCGFCSKPISPRYPLIEIISALLCVHLGYVFGVDWQLLFALVFVFSLIGLSAIDLDHQILPDGIVLPLLWMGLIANSFNLFTDLQSAVTGVILGYMVLWTLYQIHHKITGKEGMGYGDFKLLAAIGAWLGWQALPVVILVASLSGTLFAVILIATGKSSREIPIPFGPYLAVAAWIALVWGDKIRSNYLQLFNL